MNIVKVDALGDVCPVPVVKANKAIAALKEPAVVEIHVDNETSVQNLTRLGNIKGLDPKAEKIEEKHYIVRYTVKDPAGLQAGGGVPEECPVEDARGNVVVSISSDKMGVGDEKLGDILMKSFFFALSQQDKLPKAILFYNGGAKLTIEGSPVLEDIKSMDAQGVEVLTCGTCLDFYGIKDKLAVGGVTNMYSIVEYLENASKVVKP
ncbi:MAG: sulfurtransferase-like selenium metabolism protein YedF [Firmicutes bacterium]|nr:sulfurtransferase-like selenium metabolism protein YedF [Bacillota bacterium]